MRNRWPVIKALAECKLINLNVKELESGWTPAAYALYSGHLQTVVEMERLRPNEINYESIDNQGNTLLTMTMQTMKPIMRNTTVTNSTNDDDDDAETTADSMTEGSETEEIECSSSSLEGSLSGSELYTWGPNSNYNLCLRDGDDRTFPERVLTDVFIPEDCYSLHSLSSQQQYPVKIAFSKYHSAILTAGPGGRSLLMAGIGAGGRLGLGGQESQIVPRVLECPLDSKGERDEIVDVALGHDHSVLVTASGDVYTFGSNRYGQLGYSLRDDEQDCQMIPKRLNPLKRQKVIGCAASTVHSVVYTADGDVYVWGTNRGQMGCPVPQQQQQLKISPQKVNNLPLKQKCLQIVASDSVTACLMETHEVYALLHYGCYRIQFPLPPPTPRFPTSHVTRLCCNESGEVGAVDNYGNGHVLIVFKNDTFDSSCQQRFKIKSIKVSNNKNFNLKIRDLALVDSDRILICTIDSHLYTGQRNAKKNSRSGSRFYDLSPRIPMKPVKSVFAGPLGTLGALTRDDNRPGQFDSSCCLNFSQLIRDLYNNDSSLLLETDFFSDVLLLTADGQQLNAHQIILLSKCSRLKQLFDGSLTLSDFTNLRIQMPNIDRQRLEIQFPVDLSDLSNIVECIYLDRQLSNNTSSIIKEICDELGVTSVKLSIYQNAAKSDVVLLTGNGQLLCHKFILTLGSLFFRALLEKESYWSVREQQQINLGHLPRDIVQVLVDYLYGKSAVDVLGGVKGRDRNDLISKLLEIMSVANELLVDSLKSSCQHYISLLRTCDCYYYSYL